MNISNENSDFCILSHASYNYNHDILFNTIPCTHTYIFLSILITNFFNNTGPMISNYVAFSSLLCHMVLTPALQKTELR